MAKIDFQLFGGVLPRVNPVLLPDNIAQVAQNCILWNKDLRSLRAPLSVATPTALGNVIRSIYRIGQDLPETQYWMAWTSDVDVVRGMVGGDTSERTYFTGDGPPQVTDLVLATQDGTSYPVNAWRLGVPRPEFGATCTPDGTNEESETRVYICTYVSAWGEEGAPSPATKVILPKDGTVTLSELPMAPAGNYNIVAKRIYRSQNTDSGDAIYQFVDEIPVAQDVYEDTVASSDLGEELATLDYHMPPETMQGIVALPNGILAAFDGYDVLFCEPYIPYAWPEGYRMTVDFPIVGLGVFGSSLVVCTKGSPYLISGTHPETMSSEKLELDQSCVAKRSIVAVGGGVMYASPDGLVYVGSGGAKVMTLDHYTRPEWQALNPSGISAYMHDGRYIACSEEGGGFIFDSLEDASLTFFDDLVTAGYVDKVNDALYLCINGEICRFNSGDNKIFTWKSKKFLSSGRVQPSCALVDADAYPVTFQYYTDGVLQHTQIVANERAFRLPGGFRPREIEIVLSGTNPIRYAGLADDPREFHGS